MPARSSSGSSESLWIFVGWALPTTMCFGGRCPFRCVPAPVSPGGHAGLTRLRAGVAAGANTARFSACKV